MIVLLRGHIRNGFDENQLYDLLKSLNAKIYIHTWNIKQGCISWRPLQADTTPVTEELIKKYFRDIPIEKIIIDNEETIELVGNTHGTLNGNYKTIGWKRYWYGKYTLSKYIHDLFDENEKVLNLRFDIFSNYFSHYNQQQIMEFVQKEAKQNVNVFFKEGEYNGKPHEYHGIDNVYIGTVKSMYALASHFHFHLDSIIPKYKHLVNQEIWVYIENDII